MMRSLHNGNIVLKKNCCVVVGVGLRPRRRETVTGGCTDGKLEQLVGGDISGGKKARA